MPLKIHASSDTSKPMPLSPSRIRSRRSVSAITTCCYEALTTQKRFVTPIGFASGVEELSLRPGSVNHTALTLAIISAWLQSVQKGLSFVARACQRTTAPTPKSIMTETIERCGGSYRTLYTDYVRPRFVVVALHRSLWQSSSLLSSWKPWW